MELESINLNGQLSQANEYLISQENTKAINFLNNVLDDDPTMDNAWLLLGIAKRRIGEFIDAIQCFKTVTELKPSIEEAWGLYTVTLLDIGDFSTAEAVIQKAYELNPTNEKIKFYQENLIRIYKKFGPFF
ncbi:MAG: tetratricopeptide repeat protein [Candidatus Lokiarchaeota archaeon]|nr:tetratricopeptide repeat protein [Candidatus Lokiarchaeota archaeon]